MVRSSYATRFALVRFAAGMAVGGLLLAVLLLAAVPTGAVAAPAPTPSSGAVWPLDPRPEVVSDFDPPSSAWSAGHRGVDLAGSVGQPVRAARGGTISYAGRLAGRGVVVVHHGATRTTYEPVTAEVDVGERVPTGGRLGRLELFGSHCFPAACLHWGLLEGERYLDPLTLVGQGPVRLLPWQGALPRPDPVSGPAVAIARWTPTGQGALFRR